MKDRHICWSSYFFLGPAVPPIVSILESPLSMVHKHCGAMLCVSAYQTSDYYEQTQACSYVGCLGVVPSLFCASKCSCAQKNLL